MKKINRFEATMRIVFGIAFAVLFSTVGVSMFVINKLNVNAGWIAHTHEVITQIDQVTIAFGDSRSSTKNYMLTRNPRHLAPRISSYSQAMEAYAKIDALTVDNDRQQAFVLESRNALENYKTTTDDMLVTFDKSNIAQPDFTAYWVDKTVYMSTSVVNSIIVMRQEEERLLIARSKVAYSFVNQAYGVMPFMLLVQLIVTIYMYWAVLDRESWSSDDNENSD